MRWKPLLLALLSAGAARAADPSFVRVWPGWYDAGTFKRISEHFDGEENTGGAVVRRTHPASREGYYFVARMANRGAGLAGTCFVLQVVTPDSPVPRTYRFPADVPAGGGRFELGLTGGDWAGPKARPVAWELELQDPQGRTLAAQQSFLWSKPDR